MECYTSHVKMQLFKKGSSSSSPTEAIKIDNKGMTKEANHGKISNRSRNQHQPTHYTTLQDAAKLDDPDAKSPSLSKKSFWVNPRSPRAKQLQQNSPHARSSSLTKLAKSLDSCNPTEEHVSEILNVLGNNVAERDAVFILNTMANPNIEILKRVR